MVAFIPPKVGEIMAPRPTKGRLVYILLGFQVNPKEFLVSAWTAPLLLEASELGFHAHGPQTQSLQIVRSAFSRTP